MKKSVLEIIASRPDLLENYLKQVGLTIIGTKTQSRTIQTESIVELSTYIDDDSILKLTNDQRIAKAVAESRGYIVGLSEGLDQMPGSWPSPAQTMANKADKEREEKATGQDEEGEDGPSAEGEADGMPPGIDAPTDEPPLPQ